MIQLFKRNARSLTSLHLGVMVLITASLAVIYYQRTGLTAEWFPWFREVVYFEYINNLNGVLFIIPFIYATVVFGWRGSLGSMLLFEIIILPYVYNMVSNDRSFIYNAIYLCIPALVIGFFTIEFKWREKERKVSAERDAERKSYTSQIFKAQEKERSRIAQELHDDTIQMLYVIANRARDLVTEESGSSSQTKETAEWIRNTALNIAEDVRRISLALRPSILDDLSLVPAIRWMADRLNVEGNANIQVRVTGEERKFSPEVDVMIYRIIQEAITNARKHAQATRIQVGIEFSPGKCEIDIEDNGEGFPVPQRITHYVSEGKLGLIGMQQRAEFLGGTFEIESEPEKGTAVRVTIPAK